MKILALELSTARGSLAWLDDAGQSPQPVEWPNDRKNSGRFFENLQTTIQEFGVPTKIVVGLGPGSYAGIRIAISAAIGISAAEDVELLGYPSVCAMNHAGQEYAVVGDARRRSFFFVRVNDKTVADQFELLNESDLAARLQGLPMSVPVISSDLLPQFQPRVEQRFPSAEILARLVGNDEKQFYRPPLEPIYLREANITMPKTMNRGLKA